MVQRKGGFRRKSRHKMRKSRSEKGKISLKNFLQEFQINDRVYLAMEPAYQKGIYHLRFHGSSGVIVGKQGRCYEVAIKHLKAERKVIVHPIHLRKVK